MSVRDFFRNYTSVTHSTTIYKRNTPIGVYFPYNEFIQFSQKINKNSKTINLADSKKFFFSSSPDLSQQIDTIYF